MKRKIVFIVSLIVWLGVAWRVLAFNSARLGSVTVSWHPVDTPQTIFTWSPRAATYHFQNHRLILRAGQSAQFTIRPPARFRRADIVVPHSRAIINSPGVSGHPIEGITSVTWKTLPHTASGYVFSLLNDSQQTTTVGTITLKLIP